MATNGSLCRSRSSACCSPTANPGGDAPAFWYPYLWSWGGKEVEADGKTVVLDTKETVESVKFMVSAYKEAFDEGGFAWDDASNNRAFLSNTCSSTSNGASIYLLARSASPTPI
jgi:multiple sugar transport system substrate-binding protein